MAPARRVIASRTLLAVDANGREFQITIAVGEPYEISEIQWACPASLEGLHGSLLDQHGIDSWQALQLAYQLVSRMLVDFVDRGGQLFWIEGRQPVTPSELFPQLRAP